jgi:hypothetical protein
MIWQLRTYQMKPGSMQDFLALWHDHVVPLRKECGFEVKGGWYDEEETVFIWIVGHPAPDGWEAIETAYNTDPRRDDFPVNPVEYVAAFESRLLTEA